MATPIDAEQLYAEGSLRATTKGLVQRFKREGHPADILAEIAVPIARLVVRLRGIGAETVANQVLAHAVHDGVPASTLAQAFAEVEAADSQPAPVAETVTVGPNGELRAGPPPPATDLTSVLDLANYLRDRTT